MIDHRDIVGPQAFDGIGDEKADGVDGFGIEGAFDKNGGGGLGFDVRKEEAIFGLDDENPSGSDALHLGDGAGEFALEGATEVGALDEVADPKVRSVKDFETNPFACRNAFGGELHAEFVDGIGRDINGGAAGTEFVGYASGLDSGDDLGDIFFAEATVEELHLGAMRPDDEGGHAGDHPDDGDADRDALVDAELAPELGKLKKEGFHEEESGGGKGELRPASA